MWAADVDDEFPGPTTNLAQEDDVVVPWGFQLSKELPQPVY